MNFKGILDKGILDQFRLIPISLHKTSFANRQPDPAFQALETPVFTSDLCKERETIPF